MLWYITLIPQPNVAKKKFIDLCEIYSYMVNFSYAKLCTAGNLAYPFDLKVLLLGWIRLKNLVLQFVRESNRSKLLHSYIVRYF